MALLLKKNERLEETYMLASKRKTSKGQVYESDDESDDEDGPNLSSAKGIFESIHALSARIKATSRSVRSRMKMVDESLDFVGFVCMYMHVCVCVIN